MQLIEACLTRLLTAYRPARVDVRAVRSPYRICPLGAHVDHQLGCVTGLPIDRGITLAFAPNGQHQVRLRSLDFSGEVVFPLDFSENARVAEGVAAWVAGDLPRFGGLMNASGRSFIDNYECGSPPLIALYETLRDAKGVYGTRFSGAGFRGACIALIDPARREEVEEEVRRRYSERYPDYRERFSIHACGTDDGARIVL